LNLFEQHHAKERELTLRGAALIVADEGARFAKAGFVGKNPAASQRKPADEDWSGVLIRGPDWGENRRIHSTTLFSVNPTILQKPRHFCRN
jgi:hypothetical protein